ncbi:bifunctional metallophosphatase/5'-nucleotidase [Phascolarctobacterium faecium]|uniref:bifunctional metallophosphatase/5'-nucleotidase n=1 Tax=Phascolarctobacterium faecium TaxID=33025 RepID=UPI0027B9EC18|nr:5'-nucleotidase C-terminal domain-containing protein [Phascolarctobacterium faecium]
MLRVKKCRLIWLTLLLLLIATAVNAAEKNFVEIDIYSVNDFHGHLRAEAADPGITVLSGVINELMKQNPVGSLLLGGGDMFSGTIDANEYQGLPVVTAMNKMGFSANTAGNHIFDYPLDVIKRQAAAANFPILGANIVEAAGDRVAEPFKPYVMLQRNGLTIGILGLTTVETKEKASQFNLQKVKILPPEQIAQVYVDELRRQGAQIIVLLTHIGSSQGENNGITGEIVPILQKIHGVDAVVTGHSHLCVSGTYGDIPVIQAGCYGEAVGRINLLYSMAAQKVVSANSRIYKLSELPRVQDNAMERFLEPIFKNIDSKYNEILAVNSQVLTNDRNGESRVGDFFMDVLKNGFKADVALYNGGAIRDTLPSGRVTVRDLLKIFPFDSTIYTAEVKGSDLRQVLEHGIGNPDISRLRFSGLQISADIRREEGQRISSVTLSDGSTLADEKYYKVISNDFMFSGGDGFYSLQNARHLRDCGKDKTFFAFALRSLKMVDYPAHDERLQIKKQGV